MLDGGGYHPWVGQLATLVGICVLIAIARWVFGGGRRSRAIAARPRPSGPPDHGLLRPVAEFPDRAAGAALRAVLSDAGIRSTLSVRRDGGVQVLVFPDDEDRARRLVPPPGRRAGPSGQDTS